MEPRAVVVMLLAVGCGRVNFSELSRDACAADCENKACGSDDGCGATCEVTCCIDDCSLVGELSCAGAIQRTCGQFDADTCLDWGGDVPCSSGTCLNASRCDYSTCPLVPASELAFAAPGAIACDVGEPSGFPWKLGQTGPIMEPFIIDGIQVGGCVLSDFGTTCAPLQVCASGTADALMCGDDCGGACAPCDTIGGNLVAQFYVFQSANMDLTTFHLIGSVPVQQFPNANGTCYGIQPRETRYVLTCRSACGSSAFNIAIEDIRLQN